MHRLTRVLLEALEFVVMTYIGVVYRDVFGFGAEAMLSS